MTILSSIRDFVVRYKSEIIRYGIAFLLMASALVQGKMGAALVVFAGSLLMLAHDQWGRRYSEHGKRVFAQRKAAQEARVQELMDALRGRLGKRKSEKPKPPTAEPPSSSKLLEEAGLPPVESPSPVPLDLAPAKPQTPEVSVTHPT